MEELRAHHTQLGLQSCFDIPDQNDVDWQIEKIEAWEMKKGRVENRVFFKVVWFRGDKQWLSMEVLCLHDPYLLKKYAYQNSLIKKHEWKWTKYFKELDELIPE